MQIIAGGLMVLLLVVAYLHGKRPAAHPQYATTSSALLKDLRSRVPVAVLDAEHAMTARTEIRHPV
jgi:hypothetical protein